MRLLWLLTAVLLLGGCTGAEGDPTARESTTAERSGDASSAARPLGDHQDESMSARAVVAALALRGFLVPNMLDITDQTCPAVGCSQALVTDTMRVTSFPSPDAATRYAQQRGLRHWQNVVVAFPPVMAASDQDKYWSAIIRIFP
jgi:hypothetical protein